MRYDYETLKELAKQLGYSVTNLLALAPKNDPFYSGTPADVTKGQWFANIYNRAGFSRFRAPHLRRVHYWTVSQEPVVKMPDGKPYENTQRCWEFLTEAGKAARYLGLVPLNGITDNKNPQPHVFASYMDGSEVTYQIEVPELDNPYVWINGLYNANVQPYHLEVWCEKSTMNDVLIPVCQRYNANLVTFEGEVSITSVCVNLLRRLDESGGKPTRIFYISDFDPAGNSMPVAMSRKLEYALDVCERDYDVRVKPLALTQDQIKTYKLPRIPIKDTEKRAGKFEAAFGEGAVELDALEALYPGTLARMVATNLSDYYSTEAENAVNAQQSALRQAVDTEVNEVLSRYQDEIDALRELQRELRAIRVDTTDYALETYEAHVEEEDDWLFDSKREYIEQIGFYKAHKGQDVA
jgi:hypothetical protein